MRQLKASRCPRLLQAAASAPFAKPFAFRSAWAKVAAAPKARKGLRQSVEFPMLKNFLQSTSKYVKRAAAEELVVFSSTDRSGSNGSKGPKHRTTMVFSLQHAFKYFAALVERFTPTGPTGVLF